MNANLINECYPVVLSPVCIHSDHAFSVGRESMCRPVTVSNAACQDGLDSNFVCSRLRCAALANGVTTCAFVTNPYTDDVPPARSAPRVRTVALPVSRTLQGALHPQDYGRCHRPPRFHLGPAPPHLLL